MTRVIANILWPSFLISILAEGCFFSAFESHELLQLANLHELPPIAGYTIGFFFFWVLSSLASSLTYYMTHAPNDMQARL